MTVKMGIISIFGCAILTSCAVIPDFPEGAVIGENYSQAIFEFGLKDFSAVAMPLAQGYSVGYTPHEFEAEIRIPYLKTTFSRDTEPKEYVLRTNQLVYIFAEMKFTYGMYGGGRSSCSNISYFTPKPFVRYHIIQTGYPSDYCELKITDADSGRVPADLMRVEFDQPSED